MVCGFRFEKDPAKLRPLVVAANARGHKMRRIGLGVLVGSIATAIPIALVMTGLGGGLVLVSAGGAAWGGEMIRRGRRIVRATTETLASL
jgi:hypothetical protein